MGRLQNGPWLQEFPDFGVNDVPCLFCPCEHSRDLDPRLVHDPPASYLPWARYIKNSPFSSDPPCLLPRLTPDPQTAHRICRNDHTLALTISRPNHFSHGADRWQGNAIGPEGGCLNAGASTSRVTKG